MLEALPQECILWDLPNPKGLLLKTSLPGMKKKYNEDPVVSYYLSGHDAALLLFYGIEQAAIRSGDGSLHIPRQALRDALYSITSLDGVTGTLSCNAFGDCALPAFNVLRLDTPSLGLK